MTSEVYYNDIDAYCCKVLRANIERGNLPQGYVDERDIRLVSAADIAGYTHVHLFAGIGAFPLGLACADWPLSLRTLTGGFPCQDISNAGKQEGITGARSGLWKEIVRLLVESLDSGCGFDIVLLENVSALTSRGLDTVLIDLAKAGFDAKWQCLRASDVGAPHQRERVFIVAYPSSVMVRTRANITGSVGAAPTGASREGTATLLNTSTCGSASEDVGNPDSPQRRAYSQGREDEHDGNDARWQKAASGSQLSGQELAYPDGSGQQKLDATPKPGELGYAPWRNLAPGPARQSQPRMGRSADGATDWLDRYQWPTGPGEAQHDWEPARVTIERLIHRVARLKALGNAIVPQCVEYVARQILGTLY